MSLVPSGCITVREALDRVGQEHFGPQWTGKEHEARANIFSLEEWKRLGGWSADLSRRVRTSDEPIIFGSGSGGGPSGNAEFASLQVERDAYDRLEKARFLLRFLLRQKLEAGEREVVVIDPSNGFKRSIQNATWRTAIAKIYIEQGRAPVSQSSGWGDLFIVEPNKTGLVAKFLAFTAR